MSASCPGKVIRLFEEMNIPKAYLKTFKEEEAIQHLLEIAGGLKSPNVGENEILYQLKSVLKEAASLGILDVTLRKLLHKAIETGRRIRSETEILKNNLSYPAIVHRLLKERNKDISQIRVLVVGYGKLGRSFLKYFTNRNVDVTLATRNPQQARESGIKVISRDIIKNILDNFDVIIGAATTKKPLVKKDDIFTLKSMPVFIDLAMPANFDPEIESRAPGLLFNLESIFAKVKTIKEKRSFALQQAGGIIKEETESYLHWLKGRKAVKIISTLKQELEQIKSEEHNRLLNDFGEMNLHQRKIISSLVNRLTSRIAHTHYSQIKEFVVHEQS